jgi:hypothetical protein
MTILNSPKHNVTAGYDKGIKNIPNGAQKRIRTDGIRILKKTPENFYGIVITSSETDPIQNDKKFLARFPGNRTGSPETKLLCQTRQYRADGDRVLDFSAYPLSSEILTLMTLRIHLPIRA